MDAVAEFLRTEQQRVIEKWEEEVRRELPALSQMTRPVLIDHMYELLEALAAWVEGKADEAQRGFEALINGHALQRLGYAVGLETLMREYAKLRFVVLREMLDVPVSRESLVRLDEGLDRAISAAIDRYSQRREELRSRFIGILGHDLRDPLSTVKISTDVLSRSGQLGNDQQLLLARMSRACERMQRMINDVLDFARGHLGGGIPANPSLNDLGEICRAIVEDAAASHNDRQLTIDTSGDLRGALDRDRVAQAISNLVANALAHTESTIEVVVRETPDHEHLISTVTSHGKAISPELQQRMFDPFARAANERTTRNGLGLGLYIVEQIVLAHGGTIDVSSNDHETTFTITWPRVPDRERLNAANG
jgi:signal transduction histidine kinase